MSLQAADLSNGKVSKDKVESAISRIEADETLVDKDREKLLSSMKRTLGLLNSADGFRVKAQEYMAAAATAPAKTARLQAEMAQGDEEDNKIIYSTLYGRKIENLELEFNNKYWNEQIYNKVNFELVLSKLYEEYNDFKLIFIEIGPHPVLKGYIIEPIVPGI